MARSTRRDGLWKARSLVLLAMALELARSRLRRCNGQYLARLLTALQWPMVGSFADLFEIMIFEALAEL